MEFRPPVGFKGPKTHWFFEVPWGMKLYRDRCGLLVCYLGRYSEVSVIRFFFVQFSWTTNRDEKFRQNQFQDIKPALQSGSPPYPVPRCLNKINMDVLPKLRKDFFFSL